MALVPGLVLGAAACGDSRPDGACLTDFDCEPQQLCGTAGRCLECLNCERGRVGTCLGPVFPLDAAPDTIRLEESGGGDLLIYVYGCDGATSEFRYLRGPDEACFNPQPSVRDGCDLT